MCACLRGVFGVAPTVSCRVSDLRHTCGRACVLWGACVGLRPAPARQRPLPHRPACPACLHGIQGRAQQVQARAGRLLLAISHQLVGLHVGACVQANTGRVGQRTWRSGACRACMPRSHRPPPWRRRRPNRPHLHKRAHVIGPGLHLPQPDALPQPLHQGPQQHGRRDGRGSGGCSSGAIASGLARRRRCSVGACTALRGFRCRRRGGAGRQAGSQQRDARGQGGAQAHAGRQVRLARLHLSAGQRGGGGGVPAHQTQRAGPPRLVCPGCAAGWGAGCARHACCVACAAPGLPAARCALT